MADFVVMMESAACDGSTAARIQQIDSAQIAENGMSTGISDTATYMRIGDPDSALALFLYVDAYKYDYDLQKEEYIRWFAEHSKIRRLYDQMFVDRVDREARWKRVEKNAAEFLQSARATALDDFNVYQALNGGQEPAFLFTMRDSVFYDLLQKVAASPNAAESDKVEARRMLDEW